MEWNWVLESGEAEKDLGVLMDRQLNMGSLCDTGKLQGKNIAYHIYLRL